MNAREEKPFYLTPAGLALISAGLFALVLGVFAPRQLRQATTARCIVNLRIIQSATKDWSIEKGRFLTDEPVLAEVLSHLKDNQLPVCPQHGTYRLGRRVADPPTCSVEGHTL